MLQCVAVWPHIAHQRVAVCCKVAQRVAVLGSRFRVTSKVLQCGAACATATHCNIATATHCNTLQHSNCNTLQLQHTHASAWCSVCNYNTLQHSNCNTLQYGNYNTLHRTDARVVSQRGAACCSELLQCVVVCCSVLQCVAVCWCSVL